MENEGTDTGNEPRALRAGSVLDPRVSLATSVHASPGVYALLLGSGVSIGAGIKTGWDIVQDLVSRAATAQSPDVADAGLVAAADPEEWWKQHGEGPLGYSALLAEVATTPAARQAVLAGYFEPQPDETGDIAAVVPSAAHRAVAQLVLRGSIRVILTTNFDRLIERALEEVGISPQVIHSPEQFKAATPLAHSRVTFVKLHGDYLDLELRNTVEELGDYPEAQRTFLERVMDEYGLIICGWSGDWDHALVRSIESAPSRRFPMFWSHLGPLGETARRVTTQHSATLISGMTADEFFQDLVHRLEALDRMADIPVSRDMAVARLKRALPDPVRRIEVFDLLNQAVSTVVDRSVPARYPLRDASYPHSIRSCRADMDTLLHLLATGAYHDDGRFDREWVKTVQRLARIRSPFNGAFNDDLEKLRHYPALLGTWTVGVAAVLAQREELLPRLLNEPKWISPWTSRTLTPAANFLSPITVLTDERITEFHRPSANQKWQYPTSHFVRCEAREPLRAIETDDESYEAACDRFEFLASMIALHNANPPRAWHGEFMIHDFDDLSAGIEREIAPGWSLLEAGAFGSDVDDARAAHQAVIEWRKSYPPNFM